MLRQIVKARLKPVVAQLVRDVVADEFNGEVFVEPSVAILIHKIGKMPPHLAAGMTGLTLAFDAWSLARSGCTYHNASQVDRRERMNEWRSAPIGPLRDWVQFYEKMGVFCYWSLAEEAHAD